MGEEENGLELSLNLSLSFTPEKRQTPPPHPTPTSPFLMSLFKSQNKHHAFLFPSPPGTGQNAGTGHLFGGTNANRAMAATDSEEVIMSSPNSTVSSLSGNKRSEPEENEGERASSLEIEEDGGDAGARKKLRLSKEQAALLEETFKVHSTLNPKQKVALAKQLNLKPRQVEVWFQNRRARTKLKQTEVDCEHLKRCYEKLSEENIRLLKEVNDLRALKLSPQFYMNNSPPTTLNMCPQCQRVVSFSTTSSASCQTPHNKRPMI